jgi:hypothetical protein
MKRSTIVIAALLLILAGVQTVTAQEQVQEPELEIRVEPGAHWEAVTWLFLYRLKHAPQLAAWVETAEGEFVRTLLVSESAARNRWRGAPRGGRPDSLPVWYHASRAAMATDIDAASAATPAGAVSRRYAATELEAEQPYVIRLEINHSFDYNEYWPRRAPAGSGRDSGVNGQPSLVYEGRFTASRPATVTLVAAGQGAVDGSHGRMTAGTAGLTTALQIIESAVLVIR